MDVVACLLPSFPVKSLPYTIKYQRFLTNEGEESIYDKYASVVTLYVHKAPAIFMNQ